MGTDGVEQDSLLDVIDCEKRSAGEVATRTSSRGGVGTAR